MSSQVTVLVLGVGGNVSQGILKALAVSKLRCRVLGACISPLAMGLYDVDRALIQPWSNSPEFPDWLIETCKAEGINAVLSGVPRVVSDLSQISAEVLDQTGAICIASSKECLGARPPPRGSFICSPDDTCAPRSSSRP